MYAPWAHQQAFATKHTAAQLTAQPLLLSSHKGGVHQPDVEVDKICRRAGGRASATADACLQGWFGFQKPFRGRQVGSVQVYGTGCRYLESKFVHLSSLVLNSEC